MLISDAFCHTRYLPICRNVMRVCMLWSFSCVQWLSDSSQLTSNFFKLVSNFASNENRRITMRYSNYVLYGCESDVLTWMVTSFGLNMAPTSTHRWSLLWPPTSSRNTGTPGLSSGGGGGGSDLDGLSEKARPCNDGLWWRQCFGEYSDAPTVSTPSDVRLDLILVASTSGGFCICTRRP